MFHLFRPLARGEFIVVGGDTAQGGIDFNFTQFMSQTRADIPMRLRMNGVAAQATPHIREALIYVYKQTGVKPVVALERQNGGSSEMHRLHETNDGSYIIYYAKDELGKNTDKLGFDNNTRTRPKMLGDWLKAFNNGLIKVYDDKTLEDHQTFIVNKNGKPEADSGAHDDGVMSCAIAYQLFQTEYSETSFEVDEVTAPAWIKNAMNIN